MIIYSQRDPKWASVKLGFGSTTIGSHGCKLTSFAILDGRTPLELNTLFKEKGAFSGDLLIDEKCAVALGWTLLPRTTTNPSTTPCIAEVDMSPSPGKQMHFVVWQDGGIIDPWDGSTRSHDRYPEVSFRNFVIPKAEDSMKKEFVKAIEELVRKDYGDNLNEKEQEDAAKRLEEKKEVIKAQDKKILDLNDELSEANAVCRAQLERMQEVERKLRDTEAKLAQSQQVEDGAEEAKGIWEAIKMIAQKIKNSLK